ncbi:OmpA family protein [Methylosinus trichosporium]|uniref:OmpA family protein n=1 Tax=Methylosinus trichosporium TaxID=426 RepID=UPI00058C7093|nr:OmpA family protein [Methylosinus trichosporium]
MRRTRNILLAGVMTPALILGATPIAPAQALEPVRLAQAAPDPHDKDKKPPPHGAAPAAAPRPAAPPPAHAPMGAAPQPHAPMARPPAAAMPAPQIAPRPAPAQAQRPAFDDPPAHRAPAFGGRGPDLAIPRAAPQPHAARPPAPVRAVEDAIPGGARRAPESAPIGAVHGGGETGGAFDHRRAGRPTTPPPIGAANSQGDQPAHRNGPGHIPGGRPDTPPALGATNPQGNPPAGRGGPGHIPGGRPDTPPALGATNPQGDPPAGRGGPGHIPGGRPDAPPALGATNPQGNPPAGRGGPGHIPGGHPDTPPALGATNPQGDPPAGHGGPGHIPGGRPDTPPALGATNPLGGPAGQGGPGHFLGGHAGVPPAPGASVPPAPPPNAPPIAAAPDGRGFDGHGRFQPPGGPGGPGVPPVAGGGGRPGAPQRGGGSGLSPAAAAAIGAAAGLVGGFMLSQPGVARVDQVHTHRRQFDHDGYSVIEEPGRTIVRDPYGVHIRHDENERFRDLGVDLRSERRGDEFVTVYPRRDGGEVVTYTDANGVLLRRIRRLPDGREIILIDNSFRGPPRGYADDVVMLPPPPVVIPRERYVVDYGAANEQVVYETLTAPPVAPVPRRYTLDEVRASPSLRAYTRSVDIDTITFDSGSWTVAPDQAQRLSVIATALNQAIRNNPSEVFLVEGHTDATGSDVDNLSLSDRRAQSVATLLTRDFDVPAENLTTQGYGEQYPKVDVQGPSRENRRVTVRRITPLLNGQGQSTSQSQ